MQLNRLNITTENYLNKCNQMRGPKKFVMNAHSIYLDFLKKNLAQFEESVDSIESIDLDGITQKLRNANVFFFSFVNQSTYRYIIYNLKRRLNM